MNFDFFKQHKTISLAIIIFLLAFSFRVWNLNKMGQVWDEASFVRENYRLVPLLEKLNFTDTIWYKPYADHTYLARYLHAPFSLLDIKGWDKKGNPIFNYDFTYNRMLSVILTSLTAVLVFLLGVRYISTYSGVAGGMIFSMLPILLGHSQLGMFEPVAIFFFTCSVFAYLLFLEKPITKRIIFAGIMLGLAIFARESHIMLIPMLFIAALIKNHTAKQITTNLLIYKTICIVLIGFLTIFVLWPMPFFHPLFEFQFQSKLRGGVWTSIPEVFFGRLMLVPIFYYVVEIAITTPFLILFLFLIGLKKIDNSKKWVWYILILWFFFPLLMSFYPKREQGIRYIIQICVPLSIIAGLGFEAFITRFTKTMNYKILLLIPLFIYQFVILLRITPYYLDYFNILVGGAKNVYEKRLFHLSWWGQGNREAMLWIDKNAKKGASIGIATSPSHNLLPLLEKKVGLYKEGQQYDYVVVNFYNVVRLGFDDSTIRRDYKVAYSVMADGAHLVEVYKHR